MAATYTVGDSKTYSTIQLAIDAIPGDLSGQGVQTVEVYTKAAGYAETIDAYTGFSNAGAADYIDIMAMVSHGGMRGQGIVLDITGGGSVVISTTAYTQLTGFAITGAPSWFGSKIISAAGPHCVFKHNLLYDIVNAQDYITIAIHTDQIATHILNNIIINVQASSGTWSYSQPINIGASGTSGNEQEIHNNIVIPSYAVGKGYGILAFDFDYLNVSNNYVWALDTKCFYQFNGANCSINYNISSDGTADDFGGTGNLVNKAAADCFVDTTPGSEDLRPKSGVANPLVRAGQDNSSLFTDDIMGTTRTYWITGAFDVLGSDADSEECDPFGAGAPAPYLTGASVDCDPWVTALPLMGTEIDYEDGEAEIGNAVTSDATSQECDPFTAAGTLVTMGSPLKMADVFKSMLPRGAFWSYKADDTFDQMLKGSGAAFDKVLPDFKALGQVRNPRQTTLLADLEREFGRTPNASLTESQRRAQLVALKYAKKGSGAYSYLQDMLVAAGFDVAVLPMVPWLTVDTTLYGGVTYAFGDFIIQNSKPFDVRVVNLGQLGEPLFQLGEPSCMVGGDMRAFSTEHIIPLPVESDRWPTLFFVADPASYYEDVANDGDMRAADTSAWTAVNSAALSKVGDAYGRVLQVAHAGVAAPAAKQTILTATKYYLVHGKVTKMSGTGAPTVIAGAYTMWTGDTTVGVEQEFSVLFQADDTFITFGGTLYPVLQFDDVSVTEIVLDAATVASNRENTLRNLILKYKPIRSWGVVLESDFLSLAV